MRIYKSFKFDGRFINEETGLHVGKCVNKYMYWYYNMNCELVKRNTYFYIHTYYHL